MVGMKGSGTVELGEEEVDVYGWKVEGGKWKGSFARREQCSTTDRRQSADQ